MAAQGNAPDPASSGIARMLSDGIQHVFVAGANIDVVDAAGAECSVGEGDALQLPAGPPPSPDATSANLVMLSSKGGVECRKGDTVTVAYTDLQDMQNSMRETIRRGHGRPAKKPVQGRPARSPAVGQRPPGEDPTCRFGSAARCRCRQRNQSAGAGRGPGGARGAQPGAAGAPGRRARATRLLPPDLRKPSPWANH